MGSLRQAYKIFNISDRNSDGKLDWKEFERSMGNFRLGRNETQLLFDYFDRDGNGTLDFSEFIKEFPVTDGRTESSHIKQALERKAASILKSYNRFVGKEVKAQTRDARSRDPYYAAKIREVNSNGTYWV